MDKQDKEILVLFMIVAPTLGFILFYFIYFMFKKQKELIRLQQLSTQTQNNAIRNERKELATQLHNDIAPLLAGLKMRINNIETPDQEAIEVCKSALEEGIQKIRKISKSVAPLTMINLSYKEAITHYIDMVKAGTELHIHYTDQANIVLNEDTNNELYRILQEIINNAIKHAKAKNLFIEITYNTSDLLIRTKDDGVGYNFRKLLEEKKLGLGLLNMRTRIENMNGTIHSPEDSIKGTHYNIRIPIA